MILMRLSWDKPHTDSGTNSTIRIARGRLTILRVPHLTFDHLHPGMRSAMKRTPSRAVFGALAKPIGRSARAPAGAAGAAALPRPKEIFARLSAKETGGSLF